MMKPALLLSAPPLAFIIAWMLAGFYPKDDPGEDPRQTQRAGPRSRATASQTSDDIPALLAEMERKIVHFPPPEVVTHDCKGMEEALNSDSLSLWTCGFGIAAGLYALEWAKENPSAMFEWLNGYPSVDKTERQSFARTLFIQWAKQDMSAALAAIPRMRCAESRAQALVSTLGVLRRTEPDRARDLLVGNLTTLEVLKRVDLPSDATEEHNEWLLSLPNGKVRTLLMAEHISGLISIPNGEYGTIASRLWERCSTDERRDMVAAGMRASSLDKTQLPGFEELAIQHAEASNNSSHASDFLSRYGESWVEREPEAAVGWALARLKGMERAAHTLGLITHAAERDFDAAFRAWNSLPEGSLREQAARRLIDRVPDDRVEQKALLADAMTAHGDW